MVYSYILQVKKEDPGKFLRLAFFSHSPAVCPQTSQSPGSSFTVPPDLTHKTAANIYNRKTEGGGGGGPEGVWTL